MTVCIATICQETKTIVFSSDRMVTSGALSKEFEHDVSKVNVLCDKCVGLVAGNATRSIEVFRKVQPRITGVGSMKDITTIVAEEYHNARNEKIFDLFFRPRGIDINRFYSELANKLPQDLVIMLDKAIHTFDLGIELIITGVDDTGGHIYTVSNPGEIECLDTIGYHSIGSGGPHALLSLIGNDVSPKDDLKHCLYNVYEAKKRAESSPGVGKLTDMGVISSQGVKMLDDSMMKTLDRAYRNINEPRKKQIEKELKTLKQELFPQPKKIKAAKQS